MFLVITLNAILAIAVLGAIVGLLAHSIRTSHTGASTVSGRMISLGRSSAQTSEDVFRHAA